MTLHNLPSSPDAFDRAALWLWARRYRALKAVAIPAAVVLAFNAAKGLF